LILGEYKLTYYIWRFKNFAWQEDFFSLAFYKKRVLPHRPRKCDGNHGFREG
jgi:hypothetical protein